MKKFQMNWLHFIARVVHLVIMHVALISKSILNLPLLDNLTKKKLFRHDFFSWVIMISLLGSHLSIGSLYCSYSQAETQLPELLLPKSRLLLLTMHCLKTNALWHCNTANCARIKIFFLKRGCPGWGANPGLLDFIYFLILHHFTAATAIAAPLELKA
jgi:hypothetical protein